MLEEIFEAITDKIACLYKCAEAIALLDMVAACVDSLLPLSPSFSGLLRCLSRKAAVLSRPESTYRFADMANKNEYG